MILLKKADNKVADETAWMRRLVWAFIVTNHQRQVFSVAVQLLYVSFNHDSPVILLPAHPASFAHKFLFQRVPGCNSIADLSLKIVFRTHKFAVGTH